MPIEIDNYSEKGAKIKVIGVGGGGGNAVNSMINKGLNGVDFIAVNTDLQALEKNLAQCRLQIGRGLTRGLGAGADPSRGKKAVEESREDIIKLVDGSDMVFVTAGMGGGTGTGGAPLVANIAKSAGSLVVGIVTKPFIWEGPKRTKQAEEGILELRKHVDTLIVIPNNRLLSIIDKNTSLMAAFDLVNQVLYNATRGISELITIPGIINVDFADVRTTMSEMGDAIMGTGIGRGENRAIEAAQSAISSPLLEGVSINGAQHVLVNVTSGQNLTLSEVNDAVDVIYKAAGEKVNVIFGTVLDENITEELFVTVIATGFSKKAEITEPVPEENESKVFVMTPRIPNMPNIKTPVGYDELREFDTPAFKRRNTDLNSIIEKSPSIQQKIDKSNPDRPAFLRRMMD